MARLIPSSNKLAPARLEARRRMVAYLTSEAAPGPDAEYDALAAQVAAFEASHPRLREWDSPTTWVLPPAKDPFPAVAHATPMLSLANAYSLEEMEEWEAGLKRLLPGEVLSFTSELKIDGLAIALTYAGGRLVSAVTRGDGTTGDDVLRNVKTIQNLPHVLPEPLALQLRGEVYYPLGKFAELNREREAEGEPPFKNPRNAAVGTLRMHDTALVRQRALRLSVHGVASDSPRDTHGGTLEWLRGLGLPVSEHVGRFSTMAGVWEDYTTWKERRQGLDYQIDGLVVKVNQLAARQRAGSTSKSPRWAVALKFDAEQAETRLLEVEIGVGRTGVLTPVALLDPVQLAGTTVSRATLHNYDQIARLGLKLGDLVRLEKGGDIIPKVVSVNIARREEGGQSEIPVPTLCPSCGSPVAHPEGEVDRYCFNPVCPAQSAERIRHFVSRRAMDIESLGPALIDQLQRQKLVTSYADLYFLEAVQLEGLERMAAKSAANVIQAIGASKTRPLDRFVFGLGIRHVGERAARVLARHFKTLETLRAARKEEFEDVDEIGPVMAESLFVFFADPAHRELIDRVVGAGVRPPPLEAAAGGPAPLAQKTVVITGTLSQPRGRWKNRLEQAGATVTGSVSKKTDFLLAGENAGSKLEAATRLEVPVLSEDEMAQLLEAP